MSKDFSDKDFLLDTKSWAFMSDDYCKYCCLIREKEHAFILTSDNPSGMKGKILVSLGYVFDGGTGEVICFESVDELLGQGWRVD